MKSIKKEFELVYGSTGKVYNIAPFSSSTLKAFTLDKEDENYIKSLVKIFLKSKGHTTSGFVDKNVNNVIPITFPEYPLPAFINKNNKCYVNLSYIQVTNITEFSNVDLYSVYLYALSLHKFMNKDKKDILIEPISRFLYSSFVRIFGKKSGLMGNYKDLLPYLRFLIQLYVAVSFFEKKQDEKLKSTIASSLFIDYKNINLDFDFKKTSELLNAINVNKIIPISENKFSTAVIKRGGISSLPMFEDPDRLLATILASSVSGNNIFSSVWYKLNKPVFSNLENVALRELS